MEHNTKVILPYHQSPNFGFEVKVKNDKLQQEQRILKLGNKLSLAKSVVGLAVIFLGGANRRPPYLPLMIRMLIPSYQRYCSEPQCYRFSVRGSAPTWSLYQSG